MNVVAARPAGGLQTLPWHQDSRMVSLVKRTTCKDCNQDEFDEFVAVCRDLNLSPLRKQIYCFIFSKGDAERRNMTLVVGIDGGRSIAARSGNYQPDDQEPQWVFRDDLKNPLTNPHGIEKCTVGVMHRPTRSDPFRRIVHTVFWEEYAPLVKSGDGDDYEWIDTGEVWTDTGKPKKKKQLRRGATVELRIDPKKEQWTRSGRNMIAKCAEMGALRKGWPEDLSRVVVDEETHRAQVIEGEWTDLTPSEMAVKADTDARIERIGGPALFATFDATGTLERVPFGQFADRMLAATERLEPAAVAALVERNREALREFWAHNANDALELRKILEKRSGVVAGAAASDAQPSTEQGGALKGEAAERLRNNLIRDIDALQAASDLFIWSRDHREQIDRLPRAMVTEVENKFKQRKQDFE
jgi:phage recombination protein Bet